MDLRFIPSSNKNLLYSSLCATDYALCQNSEETLQFGSFLIPSVIMDNKNPYDSYINLWYNVYDNTINKAQY